MTDNVWLVAFSGFQKIPDVLSVRLEHLGDPFDPFPLACSNSVLGGY